MIVLAVASGTSVDGIDVAAANIEMTGDELALTPLGHREVDFTRELSDSVLAVLPPAATTLEQVCRIDTLLGQELAAAAVEFMAEGPLAGQRPEVVVSHGQTLFHWVQDGAARGTLQMGQPAWISELTGLPVISDVRVADVAAGGHGAPMASLLDVLMLGGRPRRAAALNLGGIANVTVAGGGSDPLAFDTGPANALLDTAVHRSTSGRQRVDVGGELAASGRVHHGLLRALGDHPYYRQEPPKSTGKEMFNADYLDGALRTSSTEDLGAEDLLATLVELTATTVADALRPYDVHEVIASGGGTHNGALMQRLSARLGSADVTTWDSLGLDPGAKEAYLFALVGFLTWHGLPGTVPTCTGARHHTVAGRITPGAAALRLPEPLPTTPTALRVNRAH